MYIFFSLKPLRRCWKLGRRMKKELQLFHRWRGLMGFYVKALCWWLVNCFTVVSCLSCRWQRWPIWMTRSWLCTLRSLNFRGARMPGAKETRWSSCRCCGRQRFKDFCAALKANKPELEFNSFLIVLGVFCREEKAIELYKQLKMKCKGKKLIFCQYNK